MTFSDDFSKRAKWEKVFENPVFKHKFDIPLDEMRDRAYAQIKTVADANIVSIFDF